MPWSRTTEDIQHRFNAMKIQYHCKETCNNCGGENVITRTDACDNIIHECDTRCMDCGLHDHWAHGFFESMIDGYDSCDKYEPQSL